MPGDHHQIKTCELVLVISEALTYQALDPIPVNGSPAVLF
jgi:hypothetical protein